MKDKIFLIWSGKCDIAEKVKKILEKEYNYLCYVGGNTGNDSEMFSISETIIQQMKSCNQAIVIFCQKENGLISNNLFFELGYVLSKYGTKKVHCVCRASDDIKLPSDFENAFVERLHDKTDDEFVDDIVKYFLNRQKMSIESNKMDLISNRYKIHEMIQYHYSTSGSLCSDYELAQYILFYMQAAVMFHDEAIILSELIEFKKKHNNEFSIELEQALTISISLLEIQTNLKTTDEIVHISEPVFFNYFNACGDILSNINDKDISAFGDWARAFASENLSYVCSIYALNPDISEKKRIHYFNESINYGEIALKILENLDSSLANRESKDSYGIISLLRSYIYRQMFIATKNTDIPRAAEWVKLSFSERKSLFRKFSHNTIDSKLYQNFEMEYYLSLTEYLCFCGKENIDEFEYERYIKSIDSYISYFEKENDIHTYVRKISNQRRKL